MSTSTPVQFSPSTITTQAPARQSFLQIDLNRAPVLLPTQAMVEVIGLSLTEIVPIPDTPAQVMGVYNWRGDVLWVIDLAYFLGEAAIMQQATEHPSLVIVRQDGESLGLVVPQIGQMVWLSSDQIQLLSSQDQAATGYTWSLQLEDAAESEVTLLNVPAMMQSFGVNPIDSDG